MMTMKNGDGDDDEDHDDDNGGDDDDEESDDDEDDDVDDGYGDHIDVDSDGDDMVVDGHALGRAMPRPVLLRVLTMGVPLMRMLTPMTSTRGGASSIYPLA